MILLLDNYDSFVHNVARYLRLAGKATRVIRSDAITAAQCYQMQPEAIVLSPGPNRPEQAGCCIDVVKQLAGEIPILGICLGHQAIAVAYGADVILSPPAHAVASSIEHNNTGVFSGLPQPMTVGRYHSLCVDAASLPGSLEVTCRTLANLSTRSAWPSTEPTALAAGITSQPSTEPTALAAGITSQPSTESTALAAGITHRVHQTTTPEASVYGASETGWLPRRRDSIVMGISDHARCVHGVQFHPESLLTEQGHELIQNFFALVDRHHARARQVLGANHGTGRPVVWMSQSGHANARLWPAALTNQQESSKQSATVAVEIAPLPMVSIAATRQLRSSRSVQETG